MASFCEEEASFGILQGFTTTYSPLAIRVGTANRLISGGIGCVKVHGAQASVKEKFFPRGKASYKAKASDWRLARATKQGCVRYKYRLKKKAKQ
jgi:hypothetical protein